MSGARATRSRATRPRATRRSRLVLLVAVLLLVVGGTAGARASGFLERGGTELEALFDSTVGLYPGSDVQILGVPVGTVTAVEPEGRAVRVSMRLDHGQRVAADTRAVIVAPTLVSDRFVQLTKPYVDGEPLASGAELDLERTAVPVEIDELYASLEDVGRQLGPEGANRDGALSELLEVAAENLEGQGSGINTMIRELASASGTLAESDEAFFATLGNLATLNDMLVEHDGAVADVNRQFAAVTAYLAEDRTDLAEAVRNLGDALGIVDEFIADNRGRLRTSVENLTGPTRVLARQKKSLEEAVRTVPLVLQNFLRAYDPSRNLLIGRGNLNDITLWSDGGQTGQTSPDAPPALLPGAGER